MRKIGQTILGFILFCLICSCPLQSEIKDPKSWNELQSSKMLEGVNPVILDRSEKFY